MGKLGMDVRDASRGGCWRWLTQRHSGHLLLAAILLTLLTVPAQETPSLTIDEDTQAFAIAPDRSVAFTTAKLKSFDKIVIERDEVWIASPKGGKRRIVEPDKFMPVPPPFTYIVRSILWSPDSRRLALSMLTKQYPWAPKVKGKKRGSLDDDEDDNTKEGASGPPPSGTGNVLALLDQDGSEIKVAGGKTRFIEGVQSGTWLADGKTVVYLNGSGQLERVEPDTGKTAELFEGKRFDGIAWDARNNRAYAVGQGLSITGRQVLVQLDLVRESVNEITRLDAFQGGLTVSPSGKTVGYFRDGDTIEARALANPTKPMSVRTGPGRFEFDRDDRRVLLKRGPADKSNDLVWVDLTSGTFRPILHDLIYHDFHISPDGTMLGVVAVGRGTLALYPLE